MRSYAYAEVSVVFTGIMAVEVQRLLFQEKRNFLCVYTSNQYPILLMDFWGGPSAKMMNLRFAV